MDILQFLATSVISIAGALGIAWAFVKYLGKRIIENQFNRAIETYRFRINSKFDRISKIHEREFEVLPQIWKNIVNVSSYTNSITSPFQQYPDFPRLSEIEIGELYRSAELKDSEIERIENSSDKTKEYQLVDYWKKYQKIAEMFRLFVNDFQLNRIFLTKDLEEKLNSIRKSFAEICAAIETAVLFNTIDYKIVGKAREIQEKVQREIDDVGTEIQNRLCFSEAYQDK